MNKPKLKPRPTSVSIPEDLEPQLTEARELTRHSASDLFVRCARKALPAVVRELLREQKKKTDAYLSKAAPASKRKT